MKYGRTISVAGLIVSPGFIDPHTHTLEDLSGQSAATTSICCKASPGSTGNDGGPIGIGEVFKKWKQQGIGTNAALYIGQGTVRAAGVMGMTDAAPTAEQVEAMQ